MQFEEYALRLNAIDFASLSKAKAKPQRRDSASSSTRNIPIGGRNWTDVEPEEYSISDCEVSKKLIHLLRHGKQVHREDHGPIEFLRMKTIFRLSCIVIIGLIISGRKPWQEEEETRKYNNIVLIRQEQPCTIRALQGHSGRSLIDSTLQDNVIIPNGFFQYTYHVGCAINLHSIINS